MHSDWTRWIRASVINHFDAARQNVYMYVEGRDRLPQEPQTRFELRIDGPNGKELSANYWQVYIEVNLLISVVRSESDAYATERLIGIGQAAFTRTIVAKKYGNTTPAEHLGCLTLRTDGREGIITSDFGLINSSQGLRQVTVEGHYRMELRK
jgi:hypothetical protein